MKLAHPHLCFVQILVEMVMGESLYLELMLVLEMVSASVWAYWYSVDLGLGIQIGTSILKHLNGSGQI